MKKTLQATYRNGTLLLTEKLDPALEGTQVRVIILDTEVNEQTSGEPVHPNEQTEDEESKTSKMAVLAKWARRRSAKSISGDEVDREEAHWQ